MSVKDEQAKLENEVVVDETTEMVEVEKEPKKSKKSTLKKVGKGVAIAGLGLLIYGLGKRSGRKSANTESEAIEVEYEAE